MAGTRTELQMIKMSEIQSQEVAWLWFPFIPYGKLTIVQGDPGDGKTTLVLNIAAKLSKGEGLDSEMKLTEPLNVIYQSAEDGLADTVKPRLEAAGANCENISVIDESIKSLSMIDERLEEAVVSTKAKLLILDPIQAYLGGGMDMNRANEARDMTKKLATLAEKYQCAIVLVAELEKTVDYLKTRVEKFTNRIKEMKKFLTEKDLLHEFLNLTRKPEQETMQSRIDRKNAEARAKNEQTDRDGRRKRGIYEHNI